MRVVDLRVKPSNGKSSLRAFADVQLNDGTIVREFRVIQEPNKRPFIACPQLSWRDPESGQIRYTTIITFSSQIKGEIDSAILSAWYGAKENKVGANK